MTNMRYVAATSVRSATSTPSAPSAPSSSVFAEEAYKSLQRSASAPLSKVVPAINRDFNIILLSQLSSWRWRWPTWTRGLSLRRNWRMWNTMPWKYSCMPATRALLQIFSGAKICPNSSRYGINLNIHIEDSSTCGVSLSRNKICGICYSAGVKSDIAIPVGGRCVRFCPRRRITFSRKQPTTEISYSS